MNTTAFAQLMAAYNKWMNEKLYSLCAKIPDAERKKDLGAFFGSIHNTLDHILWADEALLIRLRDEDRPIEGYQPPRISGFDDLWEARQGVDDEISRWATYPGSQGSTPLEGESKCVERDASRAL